MNSCLARLSRWILLMSAFAVVARPPAFAVGGVWTLTGSLHFPRSGHTATLLFSGRVLVAGGQHNGHVTASTEMFRPKSSSWSLAADLNLARARASALLLHNHRVLVAGGCTESCQGETTVSAELFDPKSSAWFPTHNMVTARADFGMVLLPDRRVLVAGGCTHFDGNGCTAVTAAAELYDPSSGTWTPAGSMNEARSSFTLVLLPNGGVLAAGGFDPQGKARRSAEIYDPATDSWSETGSMKVARGSHAAVLLTTGSVLVAGGKNPAGYSIRESELYDPSTGIWTRTASMSAGRFEHTATLLGNGNVLVAGGSKLSSRSQHVLASSEIYNPVNGSWSRTGKLNHLRTGHTATLLKSGHVLAVAGNGPHKNINSVEDYTP